MLRARTLVPGRARGRLLAARVGLSFWGGVDPSTGCVIDRSHPLHNTSITDRVLVLPGGRGSCTGSQVILELLLAERAGSQHRAVMV